MLSRFKYHILLHLIILLWGFTGILGKLIGLESSYLVWHRVIIAFISLGVAMIFLKRSFRATSKKSLFMMCAVGILVAIHWVTFYKSIQLSTASLGILCLSTTTVHVAWLEPLIMKKPISWIELSLSLVVIYGIYFVSGSFNSNDYIALAYGLTSAFLAAVFTVMNTKMVESEPPSKITFYEMLSGSVFLSLMFLLQGRFNEKLFTFTTEDFLWLLFLGVICTSFAFLAAIEVMKKLGAFTVSLSINLEPVYTIVLAIFILKENELLNTQFYIGSVIIVMVVIINAFIKYLAKKKKNSKHESSTVLLDEL